jgi:NifU-like protein involved in Fe-S cluster formation
VSPVAEAIKELGALVIGAATLVTSTVALVQAVKGKHVAEATKKLVNDRTDQLLEAVEKKGRYAGLQEAKVDSRADRQEAVALVKEVAVETAAATAAKKEEPK